MQDTIWCYLKHVYLNIEWIVEIPTWLVVSDFMALVTQQFPCALEVKYLYQKDQQRFLKEDSTFMQNDVQSGSYLYLM